MSSWNTFGELEVVFGVGYLRLLLLFCFEAMGCCVTDVDTNIRGK